MLRTRGTCPDSESTFYLNADFYSLITLPEPSTKKLVLFYFLFQTPHDSERVSTFAGADESALFHRLDGIAIGRQRAYFLMIFQPPQNWVTAERISFKPVALLHVREQVLFSICEFRHEIGSFLLRHYLARRKEVSAKEIDLRFGSVWFSSGTWPLISTEMLVTGASAPASLSPARHFVVSRAGKVYDARGEFRGLPPANCLSRLSSNRTRIVVPVLELFRTSVPRSDIALARIFVLTPNHASICVDGKFTSAYSWH